MVKVYLQSVKPDWKQSIEQPSSDHRRFSHVQTDTQSSLFKADVNVWRPRREVQGDRDLTVLEEKDCDQNNATAKHSTTAPSSNHHHCQT
jgi:hypothetical protein